MNKMDELRIKLRERKIKIEELERGMEHLTHLLIDKVDKLDAAKERISQLERVISDKVIDQMLERGL